MPVLTHLGGVVTIGHACILSDYKLSVRTPISWLLNFYYKQKLTIVSIVQGWIQDWGSFYRNACENLKTALTFC